MVPLATGANALDEDRACRVEVRDLLGETDDAAVTDLDDSTDRLAFAGAFRDRPGCNDTVDTGEFHLSAGTIKDQFSRGSRVRFELVLECVGHDSRSEDCCRNKLPDHRNPELDQVVTDIEYLAAKTDANIGGTKGPNPQPGLLGDPDDPLLDPSTSYRLQRLAGREIFAVHDPGDCSEERVAVVRGEGQAEDRKSYFDDEVDWLPPGH